MHHLSHRCIFPNLFAALAISSQLVHLSRPTFAVSSSSTCTSKSDFKDSESCKMSEEKYAEGSASVVFVTTPDENSAKKLARGLVERKLAACVNIIPQIQSIYMWEGKINEDNEFLMMIKTRSTRIDELTKWVRENHSYSVAEVISLPIQNGNFPYLNWIAQTVPEKS